MRGPRTIPQESNDWVGDRLLVRYMAGPDADPEGADRTVTDQPEARTELLYLEEIGAYCVVVKEVLEKPWNTAPTALVNGLERSPSYRLVWSLVCPEALEKARYEQA